MPIDHRIDAERRLVVAQAKGELTIEEILSYQREVLSRPEVAGFDELVDVRGVERFVGATAERARTIARLSASSDRPGEPPGRMAIVVSDELGFGLARMYESVRDTTPGSNKQIKIFRDHDEALRWVTRENE